MTLHRILFEQWQASKLVHSARGSDCKAALNMQNRVSKTPERAKVAWRPELTSYAA